VANRDALIGELEATRQFFLNTLACLDEGDSGFAPREGMYTVAAHVYHAADSVEWFVEGAFGKGWDMEFEASIRKAKEATSLEQAKRYLDEAFAKARQAIAGATDAELEEVIPDKRIMPGTPRYGIVGGITDHTAHHRGALAVYARLLGKEPAMPYGEV
jgi:uncharacterized damage-inducible protein DinB